MPKDTKKEADELDKKINDKIEQEIQADLGGKIDAEIERQVQEKVGQKLGSKIEQRIETILPEKQEVQSKPTPGRNKFIEIVSEFKSSFHLCWKGTCRRISILMLVTYLLILAILLFCNLTNYCSKGFLGAPIYILAIAIVIAVISIFLTMSSRYPRTALILWIILDIPIIILIVYLAAGLLGLAMISLIVLVRLSQIMTSR